MAEAIAGLAIASSIISVVQLTASVLNLGWSIAKSRKDGSRNGLVALLDELTLLHGVLLTLHSQATSSASVDLAITKLLNQPHGPLTACKDALSDTAQLISDLTNHKIRTLVTRATTLDRDLASLTQRIERLKSILLLALHSDQLAFATAVEALLKDEFALLGVSQALIQDRLISLSLTVEDLHLESRLQKTANQAKEATKAVNWLSVINYEANHTNAQRLREDGAGVWFTAGESFSRWIQGPPDVLWLQAIPGAGKTILFSYAIDSLADRPNGDRTIGLAYFYFDFRDSEKRSTTIMLRCLIAQISQMAERFPFLVGDMYDRYKGRRSQPSTEELVELFVTISKQSFDRVYIFLDALDECNEREILLPTLDQLIAHNFVSVFLSSRREQDIAESLSVLDPIVVSIEAQQVTADVEIYLSKRMKVEPYLRILSNELKSEILNVLVRGANGMFRWVKCQLDILKSLKRPKSIRNALESLPGTLDETYERILASVKGREERELIRLAFQFVVFAARPMTLAEIAEAVVVDMKETEPDPEARFTHPSDVLSGCESLFILSGEYLGLAHYSIQEYLTSDRILQGPAGFFAIEREEAMADLALRCLTYINYDVFNEGPAASANEFEARLRRYPFLDYACNYWFTHCRDRKVQEQICGRFENIWADRDFPKYLSWSQVFCDVSVTLKRDYQTYHLRTPSMLYFPALWGLSVLCAKLVALGHPLNQPGGYYGSAIQAAAVNKHSDVVKFLIDKSVDINQQCGYFGNALQGAVVSGDYRTTLLLIENGAQVDSTGGTYGTPLQGAARQGHLRLVQLLVHHGADVNQLGGPYGGALQAAANNGHLEVVRFLVMNGASVSEKRGAFGTALEAACSAAIDHQAVVKYLLQSKADPDTHGGLYSRPLIAASLHGHVESVRYLLDFGAEPNVSDGVYGNPLHSAAMNGHEDTVLVLLERGALVNARGGRYSSAIQAASRNGHVAIVRSLLKHGAAVNESAGYYGSGLQASARNGFADIVQILLEHGGNPNSAGGNYGNPTQAAASSGHDGIVQMLLDSGADPNQAGGAHHTALAAAAKGGHLETVKLLLEAGADAEMAGGKHGTPLDAAVASRHLDVVHLLQKHLQSKRIETRSELTAVDTSGTSDVGMPLSVFLKGM